MNFNAAYKRNKRRIDSKWFYFSRVRGEKRRYFRSIERIEIDYILVSHLIFDKKYFQRHEQKFRRCERERKRERHAKERRFSFYLVLLETCLYVGGLIDTKDRSVSRDKNLGRKVSSICVLLETRNNVAIVYRLSLLILTID